MIPLINLSLLLVLTEIQTIRADTDEQPSNNNNNDNSNIESSISSVSLIEELNTTIEELKQENKNLLMKNLELSDKMNQMRSRHQDIIIALTWQYDQLERKAQVYYNSFQTQKQNYGEIATRIIEPTKVNDKTKNTLIPLLWAKSLVRQQQHDKVEAEIQKINDDYNYQKMISAYQSYTNNNDRNEERNNDSDSDNDESIYDRPVARSFGQNHKLSDSDIIGITLKSALGDEGNGIDEEGIEGLVSNGDANGGLFSFKKSGRGGPGIKRRNLNNKNKEDIFADISFLSSGDFNKKVGGIRRRR